MDTDPTGLTTDQLETRLIELETMVGHIRRLQARLISEADHRQLPLADVVDRLLVVSEVTAANEHLVRFRVDGYEITLFADARAIIKGTDSESVARSLYSKYIGI